MDFLSHLLAIAGLFALVWLYSQWKTRTHTANRRPSPPEPPGAWPIIGHLHLLGGGVPVARTLAAMADKCGPIFAFRLGVQPVLVVCNWEAIKECFTTNDRAFASRPVTTVTKYLSYDSASIGFAPYGPYWREVRRLATFELLSARRLEMLGHVRVSEVAAGIQELYYLAGEDNKDRRETGKVTISSWIEQLTLNIIVRMIAGKRYFDLTGGAQDPEAGDFRRVIKEFMYVTGEFSLSDVIPFPPLRWVASLGKLTKVKRIMKELDSILDCWIDEHVQRRVEMEPGDEQDFIDVMLSVIEDAESYGYTRETIIKATIQNLISAGSDSTSVALTWLLSILLNDKHALSRAQAEIDAEIGKTRWVQESDIKNLIYLQAVVKETLRLYPPGPLSVPHQATEDCVVGGFHVPKGTRLLANVWKLHRDPRVWSDPEKFTPERFLAAGAHAAVDVSGRHFEFVPFGSGRRSCPGITFATQVVHLTLARLLQGFELATPEGEAVDMTEGLGITLPRVSPLEVLITPRLASELYMNA